MAVPVGEGFPGFAALLAAEDITEHGSQVGRIDGVENGPHLGVTRNAADVIDGSEIVARVIPALVESQQGRILQREQGQARHQGIAQRNAARVGTTIRHLFECGAEPSKQPIGGEILASLLAGKTPGEHILLRER